MGIGIFCKPVAEPGLCDRERVSQCEPLCLPASGAAAAVVLLASATSTRNLHALLLPVLCRAKATRSLCESELHGKPSFLAGTFKVHLVLFCKWVT